MATPDFQLFTSMRYDSLLTQLPINVVSWDEDVKSSPFYMLPYHRDRLLHAAERFEWTKAADVIRGPVGFSRLLEELTEEINTSSPSPFKVRILLSYEGSISVEYSGTADVMRCNLYPSRIPPPRTLQPLNASSLTGGALMLGNDDNIHGDPSTDFAWDVVPDTARTKPSSYTSYKTTSRNMYTSARERVGIKDMAEKREVLIVSEKDGEIMEGSLTSVFFWRNGKWTTPPASSGGQVGTTRRWALEKG
jgi:4-amino-4-deoxychorismate lyase